MIHNKIYEIIKQFLGDYDRKIYGRELENKISISQKNIALTLDFLEKEGILSSKTSGNRRYFNLNKSNELVKKYIILAEIMNSIEFLKKNPKISHIFEKFQSQNNIICIFGSYAKGIQKKGSDLDLFIIGKIDEKKIKELGENYNIEISIKKGTKTDFLNSLKKRDPLMKEILKSHIIIKGYEEFVEEVIK